MSKDSKTQLKTLIKKLIYEVLNEAERQTISKEQVVYLNPPTTLDTYLKEPGNKGLSFSKPTEIQSLSISGISAPFEMKTINGEIFEIRYRSTNEVANGGKLIPENKLTVLKKIQSGDLIVYKTFTLVVPSQNDEDKEQDPKKPKKSEPVPVKIYSSDSFTDPKGDPKLLSNFLQAVNSKIKL